MALTGAASVLTVIPLERPVFLREYSSGMYSIMPYFLSKTIVDLIVNFMGMCGIWVIPYFAVGFQIGLHELIGFQWLTAIAISSMATWIGCSVTSPTVAAAYNPVILVPQILFSGLFLKTK